MFKRAILILLLAAVGGSMMWLSRNSNNIARSVPESSRQASESQNASHPTGDPSDAQSDIPESKRHAASAVEQQRQADMAALDQKVRDQEDKLEARRKVLANIVRTKGIIYKESNPQAKAEISKNLTPEEANKRALDAQDYVEAKRDYETDQQLLQEMKLKQASEKTRNEAGH